MFPPQVKQSQILIILCLSQSPSSTDQAVELLYQAPANQPPAALRTSILIKLSMVVTSGITLPTSLVSTWFSALYCRCLSSLVRLNSVRSTSCLGFRPLELDKKGQLLTNGKKELKKNWPQVQGVLSKQTKSKASLLNSDLAFL